MPSIAEMGQALITGCEPGGRSRRSMTTSENALPEGGRV